MELPACVNLDILESTRNVLSNLQMNVLTTAMQMVLNVNATQVLLR
jgi:hypothetical protein